MNGGQVQRQGFAHPVAVGDPLRRGRAPRHGKGQHAGRASGQAQAGRRLRRPGAALQDGGKQVGAQPLFRVLARPVAQQVQRGHLGDLAEGELPLRP